MIQRLWHALFGHPPAVMVVFSSNDGDSGYYCICGAKVAA